MRITRVITLVIWVTTLLLSPPDPPSTGFRALRVLLVVGSIGFFGVYEPFWVSFRPLGLRVFGQLSLCTSGSMWVALDFGAELQLGHVAHGAYMEAGIPESMPRQNCRCCGLRSGSGLMHVGAVLG